MNNKIKPRVALIYGGRGYEREVSVRGKEHILPLIDRDRYDVYPIYIDAGGQWLYEGEEIFLANRSFYCPKRKFYQQLDLAFPLLHGDYGEDGMVQGALECAKIPYVGSDYKASAVCRDKYFVKTVAESLGIPALPYLLLLESEGVDYAVRRVEESFIYPIVVKPTCLGSSVGVYLADTKEALRHSLKKIFEISGRVIAEPYLEGKRELECSYFSTKGKELFTNPGEILCDGLYGYEEKYHKSCVELAIRADIEPSVCEAVREYSRRLVRTLGVRDISRVDFLFSKGKLYFNEINTFPGFTEGSLYARMIEAVGITERELLCRLIDNRLSE